MTCLMKMALAPVVILALGAGLFWLGLPQGFAARQLVAAMEKNQGLTATLGGLSFAGVDRIALSDLVILDPAGGEPLMSLERVEVGFALPRIREGIRAADEIVLDGGKIRVDRLRALKAQRTAPPPGEAEQKQETGSEAPSEPQVTRRVIVRHMTLDGGTKRVGFAFLKTTVDIVVEDVEAEIEVRGPKAKLVRLVGTVKGIRLPEVRDVEFDRDAMRDPDRLGPVPGPLRGLLVAVGILLGRSEKGV